MPKKQSWLLADLTVVGLGDWSRRFLISFQFTVDFPLHLQTGLRSRLEKLDLRHQHLDNAKPSNKIPIVFREDRDILDRAISAEDDHNLGNGVHTPTFPDSRQFVSKSLYVAEKRKENRSGSFLRFAFALFP